MKSVLKVGPQNVYCINTVSPVLSKTDIDHFVHPICQKEINNWVQIVNSKTGRIPQFNELGFRQILNENKSEVFIFNV
jgi:hypothetical protein